MDKTELILLINEQNRYFKRYGEGLDNRLPRVFVNILRENFSKKLRAKSLINFLFPFTSRRGYSIKVRIVENPCNKEKYRMIESIRLKGRKSIEIDLIEIIRVLDERFVKNKTT